MSDLISRQEAIDALTEYGNGRAVYISVEEAFRRIEQLPSAQPDLCDGCDRYGASCVGEGCGKLEMPEVAKDTNVPINDYISRQSAIEVILADKIDNKSLEVMDALGSGNEAKTLNMTCDRHAELLKSLPSAQHEIIMCKDCEHYKKEHGWNCIDYMVCAISPIHKVIRKPDDYCSRAKRKE